MGVDTKLLEKLFAPIKRRIRLSIRRSMLTILTDSTDRQTCQVRTYRDETTDDIERFQNYGHTSVPPKGSEAILLAVGANQEELVVICMEDKTCRPKDLEEGDNCLYHLEGHNLRLSKDGLGVLTLKKLVINAEEEITMITKKMTLSSEQLQITATQEMNVTAPKTTFSGVVFASDYSAGGINYLGHKHTSNGPGKPTETPML